MHGPLSWVVSTSKHATYEIPLTIGFIFRDLSRPQTCNCFPRSSVADYVCHPTIIIKYTSLVIKIFDPSDILPIKDQHPFPDKFDGSKVVEGFVVLNVRLSSVSIERWNLHFVKISCPSASDPSEEVLRQEARANNYVLPTLGTLSFSYFNLRIEEIFLEL